MTGVELKEIYQLSNYTTSLRAQLSDTAAMHTSLQELNLTVQRMVSNLTATSFLAIGPSG